MANESIVLGGGCFWCLDTIYRRIEGVTQVTSGYAGGDTKKPSYEQVCTGTTNHAEVIKVDFDDSEIDLKTILDIFWSVHNPTTRNQQGNDIGSQYRSAIYYTSDKQRETIDASIRETAEQLWDGPITTEIKPLDTFWPAENYHQDYFNKNPEQGYCQIIINPKLAKCKKKFKHLLKD